MDGRTRELVRQRAGHICEYCRIPQNSTPSIPFHVEHTIARQHGGSDDIELLALACDRCNAYKGPNLTSIDPDSGQLVQLFNPRRDNWNDHFSLNDGMVEGLTNIGRATAQLLNMNASRRIQLRREVQGETDGS